MRSVIPFVIVAGLAAAIPTPSSLVVRQTAYDVAADVSTDYIDVNKRSSCNSLLEDGCGPLRLSGDSKSGLLGADSEIAGIHLRHAKRGGLLDGLGTNGLGDKFDLSGLKNGGAFAGLDRPLGGIGIKRDPFGENKRLLTLGRPVSGFNPDGNCPAGRRYCCRHVRSYSDPRNSGLLGSAFVQDGSMNDLLVGLTCDLVAGTLAPNSCDNHAVCCTSQRATREGIISLGCTPWGVDINI